MTLRGVNLAEIRIDGGTQPRVAIDEVLVAEYAEAMRDGAAFPPVVVFHDGVAYWLADGFHRYHASRRCELLDIPAEVRAGTQRDAVLYAVGANAAHGQRRTNADKRKAVLTLLADAEWRQWSAKKIAATCHVSDDLVEDMKRERTPVTAASGSEPERVTYTTKHGTVAEMNTERIGRGRLAAEEVRQEMCNKEEAPAGIRRLPQQDDLEVFRRGVQALTGLCLGLRKVTTDSIRSAIDREELLVSVRRALGDLRHVYKSLGGNGDE